MNKKEVPLSINFGLDEEDLDSKYLNQFLNDDIVKVKEDKSLKCTKCGQKNIFSDDISFCSCGARLSPKNAIITKSITKINYVKLLGLISSFITKTLEKSSSNILDENVVVVSHKNKQIYFIIPEISDSEFLIRKDSDRCIVIYLDPRKKYGLNLFKNRSFYIGQFLDIDPAELLKILNALSENPINDITKSEKTLSEFLDKLHKLSSQKKGAKFEIFVTALLDKLKTPLPNKLELLRVQHPDDLYNSKIVNIGSAGNEDFHIMNLYDYLSCINPEKSGQAKCYDKSEFTTNDLGEALRHARESDILMVTTTDKVAPSVWRDIIDMKNQKNYYKYVLIDRKLLFILFSFLSEEDANLLTVNT